MPQTAAEPQTLEQYREQQRAEYAQYVAAEVIEINGARAFNPGDPVPASHVTRGVVRSSQVKPAQPAPSEPSSSTPSQKG